MCLCEAVRFDSGTSHRQWLSVCQMKYGFLYSGLISLTVLSVPNGHFLEQLVAWLPAVNTFMRSLPVVHMYSVLLDVIFECKALYHVGDTIPSFLTIKCSIKKNGSNITSIFPCVYARICGSVVCVCKI